MPGEHLRIDNRLIHGQVTVAWTGRLGVRQLVVCNDEVAEDEMQRLLLPHAARGLPTSVLSVVDTIAFCAAGQGDHTMIVAKDPEDAFRLVEGGLKPAVVNVANVAPQPGNRHKMVTRSVAVTGAQADGYRKLAAEGVPVVSQLMPSDKAADFVAQLDRKGL